LIQRAVTVVGRARAAHSGPEKYARRRALLVAELERGALQRLLRCHESELAHAIEHPQARSGEVGARVERRGGCDARRQTRAMLRQNADPGASRDEVREELVGIVAARSDHAHPRDGDAFHLR
jgi:hypothetical protein